MVHHILTRRGFTLVELAVSLAVIAILATAVMPMAVRGVELKAGEKTISEVFIIQDAARRYHHDKKSWPVDLAQMQAAGYLSPMWALTNAWGKGYQLSSTPLLLTVATDVPATVTGQLQMRLPMASVAGTAVSSSIGAGDSNLLAPGVIVAWSGSIADIPLGWTLCDGTNGAPDLRDKFIIGARQDAGGTAQTAILGGLSRTGGSVTHDHGGQTGSHVLSLAEIPPHSHGYYKPYIGGTYDGHSSPLVTSMDWTQSEVVGGGAGHTHGIAVQSHIPPYYALAFIMKLP